MLIGYGAKVIAAASASEALEALNQPPTNQFDLMSSDIVTPEMDGYSLIRRVRELKIGPGGKLPAIALTAYAQTQDRLRARRRFSTSRSQTRRTCQTGRRYCQSDRALAGQ